MGGQGLLDEQRDSVGIGEDPLDERWRGPRVEQRRQEIGNLRALEGLEHDRYEQPALPQRALEMARSNVAKAGLDDRISLRAQDVTDLDDSDRYDAAWLPSFFIAPDKLREAVTALLGSLRPGGVVILGHYEPPPIPVAQALFALRILRDGGSNLAAIEARELLSCNGYTNVRALERTWKAPIAFTIGRKG